VVTRFLEGRFPQVAESLREAEEEILSYMTFPRSHWKRIHFTNPLERVLREVGRRCDVVGIFPNRKAALRLVGAVLEEQQNEWEVGRRYFSPASMEALYQSEQSEVRAQVELTEEVAVG